MGKWSVCANTAGGIGGTRKFKQMSVCQVVGRMFYARSPD